MKIKTIGQRMTAQRRLLLRIISDAGGHVDADELFHKARSQDKRISLATISRNLTPLKAMGLVTERHLGEEHHHYEITIAPEHHHLVCRGCGDVFEFMTPLDQEIKEAIEAASQYRITAIDIDMSGYCPHCQTQVDNQR